MNWDSQFGKPEERLIDSIITIRIAGHDSNYELHYSISRVTLLRTTRVVESDSHTSSLISTMKITRFE